MATTMIPPWAKPSPKWKSKTTYQLTPTQKAAAYASARASGRRSARLIDNLRVVRESKK